MSDLFCPEPATADGVVRFLSNSVTNLKELTLKLPCCFFSNKNIFDTISSSSSPFDKLRFNVICEDAPHRNTGHKLINDVVLLEGISRVIEKCHPMKHLGVYNEDHPCNANGKPIVEIIGNIFRSIVTSQSFLESFIFRNGWLVSKADSEFIIESLPYCKIDLTYCRHQVTCFSIDVDDSYRF